MGQSLKKIAQTLRDTDKKVQLIYAFNGVGKTRLSRKFKELVHIPVDTRSAFPVISVQSPVSIQYRWQS